MRSWAVLHSTCPSGEGALQRTVVISKQKGTRAELGSGTCADKSMSVRSQSASSQSSDQVLSARRVIEEHLARCDPNVEIDSAALIRDHPELMSELETELWKLDVVRAARRRAAGSCSSSVIADSTPAPNSFPGYQISGPVQRGGQGLVYPAIQKSRGRKVAIKVMREGPFAGPHDRARFEREVRILASLKHPNIVTIHDSGTSAGHFYFVMDYVDGRPLDVHMAASNYSVPETLVLFEKIAAAVHAAHLRGVIHRDLKPGNIRIDKAGEPQILDFGLAKLSARPDGATIATLTATGQFIGSLPWAAPEQVDGGSDRIDVRTDVYALGVILFQMLTGHFPYPVVGNMREVMDNITGALPSRPKSLNRAIDEEVDTIVVKCLHKEPERRYQSAGELARDVHRYLAGEPIEAKRDSSWYVLKKTIRRHRVPAVLVAALFVVTIVFGGAMAILYARAQRQATRAERVQSYMAGIFDKLGASEGVGTISVLDVLDNIGEDTKANLKDEPGVQAEVMEHLARLYGQYGAKQRRVQWLENALTLRKNVLADPDNVIAEVLRQLAFAYDLAGDEHKPEELFREAAERYRRHAGGPTQDEIQILAAMARFYQYRGSHAEAERVYRQALASARALHDGPHRLVLSQLTGFAAYLDNCGRYREAQELVEDALRMADELYAADDPARAEVLRIAAVVWHSLGHLDEAHAARLEAINLLERVGGESMHGLLDLGWSLKDLGRYTEAEAAMQRAVKLAAYGASAGSTAAMAYAQYFLATLYADMGRWDEARDASQRSIEWYLENLPRDHFVVPRSMTQLGKALTKLGRAEEAEPWLREALQIRLRRKPPGHWKTARTASILGECLTRLGRYEDAEPLLLESLLAVERDRGPRHRRTLEALQRIIELYASWRKPERAEPYRTIFLERSANPPLGVEIRGFKVLPKLEEAAVQDSPATRIEVP